ncbi:hypothetical protein MP478_11555 [Chryseobacterium sp. WG14]|uniref:FEKKY domain-containing protein n=1 Tax=Chryseobacterium sp. WG14 TaxID=2926909 RepID=UPI00211E39B9|nr:hypothetical protein [Chryseobacterium sp. WG14]MCQ9640022.1 hypothetical protein [Chryseobacterium sp. WG14]
MNRKFLLLTIILILLTIAVYIFEYYVGNYPRMFNLIYSSKECRLEYLAVIFGVTALVSYLISSLDIKGLSFKTKFLRIFPIVNFPVLAFFIYLSINGWVEKQRKVSAIENRYSQQATQDIKNDQVTIQFGGGFPLLLHDPATLNKIDSIRKRYGVRYINTGCVIDGFETTGQEKYSEIVYPYLDRRNGKGWEDRMQKEINTVKKNSHP